MTWLPGRVLLADEETVEAIACAIDPRYRGLVLLLRYTALRWNEALALRRGCCFVREGSIEVAEQVIETRSGPRFRSLSRECGWVSVRDGVKEALAEHLARYVAERQWFPALRALGLPSEEGDMGVDTLGTARLWLDIKQAGALRASYSEGWKRGGGIGA